MDKSKRAKDVPASLTYQCPHCQGRGDYISRVSGKPPEHRRCLTCDGLAHYCATCDSPIEPTDKRNTGACQCDKTWRLSDLPPKRPSEPLPEN